MAEERLESSVPVQDSFDASARSWQCPYRGDVADVFLEEMDQHMAYSMRDIDYAHASTVLQSSGTGKSRMLDEVAKKVWTVTVNLRNTPNGDTGFPFADRETRNWLTGLSGNESRDDLYTRCYAWLAALFRRLSAVLIEVGWKEPQDLRAYLGYGVDERVARRRRQAFLHSVINEAESLLGMTKQEYSGIRDIHHAPEKSSANPMLKIAEPRREGVLLQSVRDFVAVSDTNLAPSSRRVVKFIICVDEARGLWETQAVGGSSVFDELARVLRSIFYQPVYGVFLSSTAPPTRIQNRSRVSELTLHWRTPFVRLGLDQLVDRSKWPTTLDEACRLDFLLQLGRPLFGTRYTSGSQKIRDDIIAFARQKLMNTAHWKAMDMDTQRALAAFAPRLPLDLNPLSSEGRSAALEQVQRHMRICLMVDKESGTLSTVAPSEPILAEGAALAWKNADVPRCLERVMKSRILENGHRMEMIGLTLLLLAHDEAALNSRVLCAETLFHRPVPLVSFLECLLARPLRGQLRQVRASNSLRCPRPLDALERQFSRSFMHFSHFVKVYDDAALSPQHQLQALSRGLGFLCAGSQHGIDAVTFGTLDGKQLRPDNILIIMYQFKDVSRMAAWKPALFHTMDPCELGLIPADQKFKAPPVIKIVMSLSRRDSFGRQDASLRTDPEPELKTRHHPSYDLFNNGCSSDVYGVIRKQDERIYSDMLLNSMQAYPALSRWGGVDEVSDRVSRSMQPCASRHQGHWEWAMQPTATETTKSGYEGYDESQTEDEGEDMTALSM